MPIEEGKAAPAFTLPDQDGNKVALKDFRGKDVIVYFYPRDDTPGCTKEACGFRDSWKTLQKRGVIVLGISADDADSHTAVPQEVQAALPAAHRRRPQGDGEVRRLRREDDVRQEDRRSHPLDRLDRPRPARS